jgi:hypothetical protein
MEIMTNDNWLLTVGTFLPLVGVLVMLFIPKAEEQLLKTVAVITAGATMAVGILTLFRFDYGQAEKLQFFVDVTWIEVIRSNYTIGLDGISLPLYFLSMVVTFLVIIYTWDNMPDAGNPKSFLILMLVLQVGMAGTFVAQDLILFFVFFEVVLLPMYFMIGVWGGEQRQYASLKFFLYTMFGSAFMLVAFLALFFQTGAESFSFMHLVSAGGLISKDVQIWIFAGMFLGFAVKVPMFPFHTWLPDAHTQAPTQGLGDPGSDPAQVGYLRLCADRDSDAAPRRQGLGTRDRDPRCDRHHLWRTWLFGPNRHETPDRFQFGGPHGLCDVGHLHFDHAGHQCRAVWHGGTRLDHRHVVLRGWIGQAPLPHLGDQASLGDVEADASTWDGFSVLRRWPRSACRAWRASGANSRRSWPRTHRVLVLT